MSLSSGPSLTFHPEPKRRSLSFSLPNMHSLVGGAHFTAASESTEHERELSKTTSILGSSDVRLEGKRRQVVEDVLQVSAILLVMDLRTPSEPEPT